MASKDTLQLYQFVAFLAGEGDSKPLRRKTRPKFSGVLKEPMVWMILPPAGRQLFGREVTKERRQKADQHNIIQLMERIRALYEHYGIEDGSQNADFHLAIELARDFVPGFEILTAKRRGRGKPKKWGEIKSFELLADVAFLKRKRHSALNACRLLTQLPEYDSRYRGELQKNLYRRYLDAKRDWPSHGILGKTFAAMKDDGYPIEDWLVEVFAVRVKGARISQSEN